MEKEKGQYPGNTASAVLLSFRIFVNNASNLEGIVGWPSGVAICGEAVNDSENVIINSPFQTNSE